MMDITKEELKALLAASNGDKYFFDEHTTFIKEQTITVQAGATFYNGNQDGAGKEEATQDIIEELRNCFYGSEEDARDFISKIKGLDATSITDIVKKLVEEKKIAIEASGKRLWSILTKYGIYSRTYSNWVKNIR